MKTALLVYYTFTGESKRALDVAEVELRAAGHEVKKARVDFADPAVRLQRPLSPALVKRWTVAAEQGEKFAVVLEPPDALAEPCDLICIFTSTWQHHPCVPMRSLLKEPQMQAALKGKPFAVYVVCRRSWEKNLEIVRAEAEQCGGRFIGGEHFEHFGGNAMSMIRTVTYLMGKGDRVMRLLGIRLPIPEYGLSDAAMQRAAMFTRKIAASA